MSVTSILTTATSTKKALIPNKLKTHTYPLRTFYFVEKMWIEKCNYLVSVLAYIACMNALAMTFTLDFINIVDYARGVMSVVGVIVTGLGVQDFLVSSRTPIAIRMVIWILSFVGGGIVDYIITNDGTVLFMLIALTSYLNMICFMLSDLLSRRTHVKCMACGITQNQISCGQSGHISSKLE